jgi:hypothetical protein
MKLHSRMENSTILTNKAGKERKGTEAAVPE